MKTRVGAMVATLARARDLNVSQLAALSGIHRNRLADKIAGRRQFTEGDIEALAGVLGVTPGQLFDDPLALLGVGPVSAAAPGLLPSRKGEVRRSGHVFGNAMICQHHKRGCTANPPLSYVDRSLTA